MASALQQEMAPAREAAGPRAKGRELTDRVQAARGWSAGRIRRETGPAQARGLRLRQFWRSVPGLNGCVRVNLLSSLVQPTPKKKIAG